VTVQRADRRLGLRLTVALLAAGGLGLPFLLLALLVRARWAPLAELDTTVATSLHRVALRNGWLVDALQVVSFVLGPFVLRPALTLVALVLLRRRRTRLATWVLVTVWGSALLGVVLKEVVGRARPDLLQPVATAAGRSFPSGHALGATVAVAALLLVAGPLLSRRARWVAWVVGVLAVLLVSFARVGLGVHYLTDVVAGWVIGAGWVALTAAAFEAWRREVGLPPSPATQAEPELEEGVPEPRAG
jgi:undecaprenyl-diphosphatase